MAIPADIARTALGVLGNIISLALFLSPLCFILLAFIYPSVAFSLKSEVVKAVHSRINPTFVKIWKWKSTREFSGVPYAVTLLNCLLWVFYGLPIVHPNSLLVVTINSAGTFLELIYITVFFMFSKKKERIKMMRILAALLSCYVVIVILTLVLAHTYELRTLIVGSLCVAVGTCMYASPLTIMKHVIQTKSVKYMPFFLSLASFFNGLVWTAYACIHFDIFVTLPNGLGALLGACQLALYMTYYGRPHPEDFMKQTELPTVSQVDGMQTNVPSNNVAQGTTKTIDQEPAGGHQNDSVSV